MASPLCACCGRPRKRRSSREGYEGANGWCSTCHSWWNRNGRPESGPLHPSLRGRWAHRKPPPVRVPLRSGWQGYLPSTGTARTEAAA